MAREFLMIVEESAYRTPASTPVIWNTGTSYGLANYQGVYVRLDGGNAFTMRPRPIPVDVPYGGGFAVNAYRVSDKLECKGQLTLKLCVGQAPFFLSWAGQRINGAQTSPWTTTEPAGDLASCAIYHAIQRSDGTYKRRLYLGCKVDTWSVNVSEASTVTTMTMGISASTPQGNQFDSSADPDATAFPAPADNNYPIDPYVFIHTGGSFTYGGSSRTQFTELTLSSNNKLARRFYATRFLQILRWLGRDTTLATRLYYPASPDDRTHFEGVASESVSVQFSNGTHSFTFDMKAQNVFDPFEDDLPLEDLYFQASTERNMWDPTAGNDFTLAFA